MTELLKEAIEIIEKISNDNKAEVKNRLQATLFLKKNRENIEKIESSKQC